MVWVMVRVGHVLGWDMYEGETRMGVSSSSALCGPL